MIKVTTQGSDIKEVSFSPDLTLGQALSAAGIAPSEKSTISVNGEDLNDLNAPINDGDIVVITPKVSNG